MKHIKEFKKIDWDDWDDMEEDPNIPDDFKGHEKFYNFLKRNNILDKYVENYDPDFSNIPKRTLNKCLNDEPVKSYISTAFRWVYSKQGISFWFDYQYKWNNELLK